MYIKEHSKIKNLGNLEYNGEIIVFIEEFWDKAARFSYKIGQKHR